MALVLQKIVNGYWTFNDELSDPRANDMLLTGSPWGILVILVLFYNFVYTWGPKMMENRPAYKLETLMIFYNAFQIAISIFLFIDSIRLMYESSYNVICEPVSYQDDSLNNQILSRVWLYFMVKVIDLLDTIFFVLRKKQSQVTFLHMYHHISMVLLGYVGTKYFPGGHGAMLGVINCFVHAVMYSYYLLTCINSEYKKSIWWKKHLTQLQIVQFFILFIHFTHVLFRPSCSYPKWISLILLPQNTFMIFMFSDFYIKSYIKKKKE